jgi:hypothetical protein
MIFVNRKLVTAVRRGAAGTMSRQALMETLQKRQEKIQWDQQTGYFRAHRLWEAGNQRKSSEIYTKNYLLTSDLTKPERLRAEAVRESLLGFTDLEMIYFAHCLEKEVEHRLQVNLLPQKKQQLEDLRGWVTRGVQGAGGAGSVDSGSGSKAPVFPRADAGDFREDGASPGPSG